MTYPKAKIKRVFKKVVQDGTPISVAMKEEGYADNTAKNPKNVTESKGWKELMEQHLPDELLAKKHKELLVQKQLAYFTFSKQMSDDEIIEHVKAAGFDVIVVRESDKGKLAFYSIDDSMAKKSGLDMAYKLKGAYAAEKSINLNLNAEVIPPEELLTLATQLNETTRSNTRASVNGDGAVASAVDAKVQD